MCTANGTDERNRERASEVVKTKLYPYTMDLLKDMEVMENLIKEAGLNYTVVRPVGFTDGLNF